MDILETTSEPGTHAGNLTLTGGALCLDFTNTMDWRLRFQPQEWLTRYADLVAWSRHVQILTDDRKLSRCSPVPPPSRTRRRGRARPGAHPARSHLPDLCGCGACSSARAAGSGDPEHRARRRPGPVRGVAPAPAGFAWDWDVPAGALDWMLWPVVRSTADLLVSDALSRVHECGGTELRLALLTRVATAAAAGAAWMAAATGPRRGGIMRGSVKREM